MRKPRESQLVLVPMWVDHPHAKELAAISNVLDANSQIAELVTRDLLRGASQDLGRDGLNGDQALRVGVLKQMHGFSYDILAFHLQDSACFRAFCRFGFGRVPKRATLADNVRRIRAETWEAINQALVLFAIAKGVENGKQARIDATVVETNIRPPADSDLLWDTVRVVTRLLHRAREAGAVIHFRDHTKRAKRRAFKIRWIRGKAKRRKPYRDLVRVTEWVLDYAEDAVFVLMQRHPKVASKLAHFAELGRTVVDQTRRRVFAEESVPHHEKVLSLFEPHTDVLPKDRRHTQYGHKVTLTVGKKLVFDADIADGNPADATLFLPMIRRLAQLTGRVPTECAADGSYASKANLAAAKALGVAEVCFSKRVGLDPAAMTSSAAIYRRLWRFRAGVESTISYLKRCFGLRRVTWKGLPAYESYVWASIVSCNLMVLARELHPI